VIGRYGYWVKKAEPVVPLHYAEQLQKDLSLLRGDLDAIHHYLDSSGVPRNQANGLSLSILGRLSKFRRAG